MKKQMFVSIKFECYLREKHRSAYTFKITVAYLLLLSVFLAICFYVRLGLYPEN